MGNKFKDLNMKNCTYKILIQTILKKKKVKQKYSHLLHWRCDDQIFKICKN